MPHGCDVDITERIEAQVERFAPGFRDTVLERHTTTAPQMKAGNPNDLGGDISNGEPSLRQMLARPVPRWNTYKTPVPGVLPGVGGDPARTGRARDGRGQRRPRRAARGLRRPGRAPAAFAVPG